jgi:hypothetical protein
LGFLNNAQPLTGRKLEKSAMTVKQMWGGVGECGIHVGRQRVTWRDLSPKIPPVLRVVENIVVGQDGR